MTDENVTEGRFGRAQVSRGLVKDLVDNPNVENVVAIVEFKDGSMDVYGSMDMSKICYGLKIAEHELVLDQLLLASDDTE